VLVEEDDIRSAIVWLVESHHLIAEGSVPCGVAALRRSCADQRRPDRCVISAGIWMCKTEADPCVE